MMKINRIPKPKKKERAALYARFSEGANQREESITGQMRENHLYCEKNDLVVVKEYADHHITGRTDNRPQFQQMIQDAEDGLFDVVVCYKTERFARNRFDAAIYKYKLKKCGVRVTYSKLSIPKGPEGIILESVLEGLDEYYSWDLSQKINRGMYDNALKAMSTGGPIPFGLKIVNKKYAVDEEKAPIVREIFTRYASGEQISSIIENLNQRGILTAKGRPFNKSSLHRMFKNKKYIGIYEHISSDENFDDVIIENAIPPIVDVDIFNKVQERVKMNHRKTKKTNISPQNIEENCPLNTDFLLSGKVYDRACGGHFVGDSGTSSNKKTYYYYTCINRKLKKGKCKTKSIRKDLLEKAVFDITKECILDDDVIDFISERIEEIQSEKKTSKSLPNLENELAKNKNQINNLLKAIEAGIYTESTKNRLIELENIQTKLENEILIEKKRLLIPKLTKDRISFFLKNLLLENNSKEELQKKILSDFVDAIIIEENSMLISYRFNGENNIVAADFNAIKNASEDVRKRFKWWRIGDSNS